MIKIIVKKMVKAQVDKIKCEIKKPKILEDYIQKEADIPKPEVMGAQPCESSKVGICLSFSKILGQEKF